MARQQTRFTVDTDITASHHNAALIGNTEGVVFQLDELGAPPVFDDAALDSLHTLGFTAIAGGNLDNILRINVTDFSTFDLNLDGGGGFNTLSFAGSANGVTVDLSDRTTRTIDNFQQIIGTGFDDVIIGDDQPHVLDGGGGSNIIAGGAGDDIIYSGGGGSDLVDGGGGYNTLSYERAATLLDNQGNPFGAIFDPLNGNVIYSLSGRGT
ncbi:MAG TPA: hypothetical protein VHL08_04405, partial [Dongiaceae bacterium]|nr:hypothetical protein [Dongiaceae bacterium]